MSKVIKIIADIIFYLGLSIATLVLVNRFTGKPGMQLLTVTSGSMEPALKTGGVVMVWPQKEYMEGDIITFKTGVKTTTTHRALFKMWPNGFEGKPQYLTAGDANSNLDVTPVTPDKIVGKVVWTIPYVGFAAAQTKTPQGFLLLVIIPGTIVIYEELKTIGRELKSVWKKTVSPRIPNSARKAVVMLPIIAGVSVITSMTGAYFTDKAITSGNGFNISLEQQTAARTAIEMAVETTVSPTPADPLPIPKTEITPTVSPEPTVIPTSSPDPTPTAIPETLEIL